MVENKLLGFALAIAVISIIGMFLLQGISLVFSRWFGGSAITLGPTFLLLLVLVIPVVIVSLAIYLGFKFEKYQVLLILAIIGVELYLVFKLRTTIPEIFSVTSTIAL